MRITLVAVLGGGAVLCAVLGGCGTCPAEAPPEEPQAALASGPVNAICPIGKHEVDPAVGTHVYNGREVAFCCDGCYDAWPALTEAERDAALAAGR